MGNKQQAIGLTWVFLQNSFIFSNPFSMILVKYLDETFAASALSIDASNSIGEKGKG